MRAELHDELDGLSALLVEMTRLVGSAISKATMALLDADLTLAESVISADERVDALHLEFEERSLGLLMLQQPGAADLRVIVTGLRMSSDLERMGDLARHIAKLSRMRHPRSAIPVQLRETVLEMGQVAEHIVAKTGSVIARRDLAAAAELEADDDAMDTLHRQLFTMILDDQWPHGVEPAVDVTLCGRYYERYADHAVSVARRVVFLVTGQRVLN
ncbi:MAG: phosphate signaling complex protein PhoU [Kineosporiaceae bacterium]|nr:phosphate signaling complex protein PhoU [Kineosporiaceae bacterium]